MSKDKGKKEAKKLPSTVGKKEQSDYQSSKGRSSQVESSPKKK